MEILFDFCIQRLWEKQGTTMLTRKSFSTTRKKKTKPPTPSPEKSTAKPPRSETPTIWFPYVFFFLIFFSVWLRWNFGRVDIFSWNDMVFAYIYIYAIKRGKKFNSEPYSCFRLSWGRSTFSWVAMVKNVASILVSGIYQHFVGNQTEDFEFHLNSDFGPFGCGKFRGKSLN